MHGFVKAIEYVLPERVLSTAELSAEFPEWSVEKIDAMSGIQERHVAGEGECSSDLAVRAATKLFQTGVCSPDQVDYILLCTQTPDYIVPTTACLVQDRLGIPTTAGAVDISLGHSGFVYGLGLACGLIASEQAGKVLLLTAETYSKLIHPGDKSVRTIFGDAAAATLVSSSSEARTGPFVYGTDGRGAPNLQVPAGGMRLPRGEQTGVARKDDQGNVRSADNLYMNGAEIFNFTLNAVPSAVKSLLYKAGLTPDAVDLFVFHQANRFVLEHLRKRLAIPAEKFFVNLARTGNTVSSTIPIALKQASEEGRLHDGMLVALVGYGAGYSWGATLVRWNAAARF